MVRTLASMPGYRRPRLPRRDQAEQEAEQVKLVAKMLTAGASLHVIGSALGRDRHYAAALIERHGIGRVKPKIDTRPLLILIEPVRWPDGPGRAHAPFDHEDTNEI